MALLAALVASSTNQSSRKQQEKILLETLADRIQRRKPAKIVPPNRHLSELLCAHRAASSD